MIIVPEKSMSDSRARHEIKKRTKALEPQYQETLAAANNKEERDAIKAAYRRDKDEIESDVTDKYEDAFQLEHDQYRELVRLKNDAVSKTL